MRNQLFIGAAIAALAIPAAASAQETTSQIRGTVTSNGAPVADATIVATDVQSGTRSQTSTDGAGSFTFSGLRPGGPYTVEVTSAAGNQTVTDIYTVLQQAYTLPIELTTESDAAQGDIIVRASSIRGAGTRSSGPQTVLTQADISKVASVNRDIRDIERRDPFATLDLSNSGDRGGAVTFVGVNPRFNSFTINGVTVGDTFGLNQDASPTNRGPIPYDALGQVSTSIAPYDFRQGGFQGGAIDAVLLAGNNDYHLTGFYSQNTNGLSGNRIGRTAAGRTVLPTFKSETYGVTARGPIIKDKLFFMVSYEKNADPRPFSTQVAQVPGLTQPIIDNITGIARSRYSVDPGSTLTINPRIDEKIVGRVDWNITDSQKLQLNYINAFDSTISQNNTSTSAANPQYGLSTNAYVLSNLLKTGIVQLNSDWTDNFSTEIRGLYKYTRRGQEPITRAYGQFQVCNDATSVGTLSGCSTGIPRITFGPDNFRQTNTLFFDTWAGSFLARYKTGGHELKALIDITQNRTLNNFVPNSIGAYYFDSLADYQAGRANTLQYAAIISGDPLGAAANFNYTRYTFGLQDDWQVTDTLQFTIGARASLYGQKSQPVYNQFFNDRNGFPNTYTYKGQFQFEPRASFKWQPRGRFSLRGGAGVFSGGSPDIYLSNSYSNTITTSALTIARAAQTGALSNSCTGGIPDAICQAALNNITGTVPASVATYVANSANPLTLQRTNSGALGPNFKLPSSFKATLTGEYNILGIRFGADFYYSKILEGIIFTDGRVSVVGVLPDGRPRYNGTTAFADNNYDIIVSNDGRGQTFAGVIRASKDFDFGLSLNGSYTRTAVTDVGNASSSTINSNYRFQIFNDPNRPTLGVGDAQVKWAFKYGVGYTHAFFRDYKTSFQLFGETRAGLPFSYTFTDTTTTRSPVFGTNLTSSVGTNLLYVPTGVNDPLVTYAAGTGAGALTADQTRDALNTYINNTVLAKYRGQIAPKNIDRNRKFTRIDLHLEQEIPTFVGKSRVTIFADINNLPNLLNRNWGGLRQLGSAQSLVQVACANAAGTPLTGAIGTATNPSGGCARYVYSSFRAPVETYNVTQSLYQIRLGARFTW